MPENKLISDSTFILWVYCAMSYHLATPTLAAKARSESIYKDEKFSDHAPLTIAYEGLM